MKNLGTVVLSFIGIVAGLFFFLCSVCAFGGVFDSHSSDQGLYLLCALILLALAIASDIRRRQAETPRLSPAIWSGPK